MTFSSFSDGLATLVLIPATEKQSLIQVAGRMDDAGRKALFDEAHALHATYESAVAQERSAGAAVDGVLDVAMKDTAAYTKQETAGAEDQERQKKLSLLDKAIDADS